MLLALLLAAEQDQRRTEAISALSTGGRLGERGFLGEDHLLDIGRAAAAVFLGPGHRQPAGVGKLTLVLAHPLVPLQVLA